MAHQEEQREDLLAEATALVERAELESAEGGAPVVVGFRRDGAASFYFGQDVAYHFQASGPLRRAYVDGRLYKAERGRLVSLTRQRTPAETVLVRHVLTDDEARQFLDQLVARLGGLYAAIHSATYRTMGVVPEGCDVIGRAAAFLEALGDRIAIADSPRV